MLTPSERSLRARIGAHSVHAKYDSRELTEAARKASRSSLDQILLAAIDPDHTLPDAERARRLEHARRAHFARLALRSAQARQRKAARRG